MPIRAENRDRYPVEWPAISASIRVGRAENRCECTGHCATRGSRKRACLNAIGTGDRCQARNGELNPRTGAVVVLTTAHLDDTPENCADENLLAMCQACHLAYDTRLHAANRVANRRLLQELLQDGLPLNDDPA